jgi:hypothetical protein
MLHVVAGGVVGMVDGAQPFCDLRIAVADAQRLPGEIAAHALQRRLDIAHGDRQYATLGAFENAEGGGELDQRRGLVEAHLEREALGVGQHAAALVLDVGGQHDLAGGRFGQGRLEADRRDGRL